MSGLNDDQLREALARRASSGLSEADRANVLRTARVRALEPQRRRVMPRLAGWLAAAVAAVVIVVVAVPVLLSSPIPVARASSSPAALASGESQVPIYSGPQLAALVGDPNWTGKTVLSDAAVDAYSGPGGPACYFGQPCYAGTIDGLTNPIEVWADWRDADPGSGAPVTTDGETRWIEEVTLPKAFSLDAYRVEADRVVLLGPAEMDDGQPWAADAVANAAGAKSSDDVYVVSGWMIGVQYPSCGPLREPTMQPLMDWGCGGTWITESSHRSVVPNPSIGMSIISGWKDGVHAQTGAYGQFALNPATDDLGAIPRFGTYLVRDAGCQQETMGDCPVWRIVGRIDSGNPADVQPAPTITPLTFETANLGAISIDYPAGWTVERVGNPQHYSMVEAFITSPSASATETCGPDYIPGAGGCSDSYDIPSGSVAIAVVEIDMPLPSGSDAVQQEIGQGWQATDLGGEPAAYTPNYDGLNAPPGGHTAAWSVSSPEDPNVSYLIAVSDNGMDADLRQLVEQIAGSFRFTGSQASSPIASSASASLSGLLPDLNVANGTTIPVAIAINGTVLTTVPPETTETPIPATIPARPWTIEALSPSGRVLATLNVSAQDYISNDSGKAVREDLACGRLDIWSGPPLLGPGFSPDPSKPCD